MSSKMIRVEVAFALPTRQSIIEVALRDGATIDDAINASNIAELYPDSKIDEAKVGIWSRSAKRTDVLKDGDRIEIYRPLIADPKEVRKRRAEKAKEEGRADKVTGGRPNRQSPPTPS